MLLIEILTIQIFVFTVARSVPFLRALVQKSYEEPHICLSLRRFKTGLGGNQKGATEVCLQGGIHPKFDGNYYLDVIKAIRKVSPDIHIHAFSPLEIFQGAHTLGLTLEEYLPILKELVLTLFLEQQPRFCMMM